MGWITPAALAHGTHSGLISLIDKRLKESPDDGKLWYQRALLEFEHEDWTQTWDDLEKTEHYAPGQFPTAWIKGQLLDIGGKTKEAKSMLDGFLAKSPEHWGALASRARVEMKSGMTAEALDDFRAALANNRDAQPDLVQEVAQALAAHGQTDEAIEILDAGLQRLGNIPSLQLRILGIEMDAGRSDAALARLEIMQQKAPRPEPWMERRASMLAESGRLPESRDAWRLLIRHLEALPTAERGSHSMALAAERARCAIKVLDSNAAPKAFQPTTEFPTKP